MSNHQTGNSSGFRIKPSSKTGSGHWLMQRLTALSLVCLTPIMGYMLWGFIGKSYKYVAHAMGNPFYTLVFSLFMVSCFYHLALGIQVIIEDYVHHPSYKFISLMCIKGLIWLACSSSILCLIFLLIKAN